VEELWFGVAGQHMITMAPDNTIIATRVLTPVPLDASDSATDWQSASPIRFSSDWRGEAPDSAQETEVRALWSPEMLYLRFACKYRDLFVFEDSDANGRRDHLWDRDVAEAFLQPPDAIPGAVGEFKNAGEQTSPDGRKFYKEFELAPNGMWIDLDISPQGLADLKSGLTRSVVVVEERKTWIAELALPMRALTRNFDPNESWQVNFYRVEGKTEPRRYMAWRPTHTPQPNFHVPEAFGLLTFRP